MLAIVLFEAHESALCVVIYLVFIFHLYIIYPCMYVSMYAAAGYTIEQLASRLLHYGMFSPVQ
jgi:hypothetical protein